MIEVILNDRLGKKIRVKCKCAACCHAGGSGAALLLLSLIAEITKRVLPIEASAAESKVFTSGAGDSFMTGSSSCVL